MEMRGHMSHNKELVFTITMMVHLYSYLYWGTRSGSCRVFVYLFHLLSSLSHGMIYRSLERHFHVEYNAFEIDSGNCFSIYGDIHILVQSYGYRRIYRGECFRTPHMAF